VDDHRQRPGEFGQAGRMQLEVDTGEVTGVADAVRRAGQRIATLELPRAPVCEDVAAADAIGALLAVTGELLASCTQALESVADLVDTAAFDYARVEAHAAR
jgi:hypothetical protein